MTSDIKLTMADWSLRSAETGSKRRLLTLNRISRPSVVSSQTRLSSTIWANSSPFWANRAGWPMPGHSMNRSMDLTLTFMLYLHHSMIQWQHHSCIPRCICVILTLIIAYGPLLQHKHWQLVIYGKLNAVVYTAYNVVYVYVIHWYRDQWQFAAAHVTAQSSTAVWWHPESN